MTCGESPTAVSIGTMVSEGDRIVGVRRPVDLLHVCLTGHEGKDLLTDLELDRFDLSRQLYGCTIRVKPRPPAEYSEIEDPLRDVVGLWRFAMEDEESELADGSLPFAFQLLPERSI
jgi:hypothetical protein